MTFAKFIKKTIEDKHLSARRVARAAGIDPSFFSKILSGKRSPPSDEKIIKKLAKALGAEPVYMTFLAGRIPDEYRELFLNENFIISLRRAAGHSSGSVERAPLKQPDRPAASNDAALRSHESAGPSSPPQEDISEDLL
jgi:transcriptional regulator with XRE-family HTH domain